MQKLEKSIKQVDYESALSYINAKGYDIETNLKRAKPTDMVEITILKNGVKYVDKAGNDRVKRIPLGTDLCNKVADEVVKLFTFLKSKEV
jgi:hypothetical protein